MVIDFSWSSFKRDNPILTISALFWEGFLGPQSHEVIFLILQND